MEYVNKVVVVNLPYNHEKGYIFIFPQRYQGVPQSRRHQGIKPTNKKIMLIRQMRIYIIRAP